MTTGVLAEFEPIYVVLGENGWSTVEVDEMQLWQVARFMGDSEIDPVIRGTRDGLRVSRDSTGSGEGGPRRRRAPRPKKRKETGRSFRGKDAR